MKKEKSCGAIVIKKDADGYKTLLIKHNKGHWSFPKGHVEKNETEEQTALREIKEETNLDVSLDTRFRRVSTYSPYEGAVKDVVFFIAEAKSGDIRPQIEEVSTCKWLDFDKAENLITFENDKNIFREAKDFIAEHYQ